MQPKALPFEQVIEKLLAYVPKPVKMDKRKPLKKKEK